MKKRMKVLLLPVVVMLLFVGSLFVVKLIHGNKIAHYKQYLYPAQGQVTATMNGIEFMFIDEEELSEMADINNIEAVYVTTETGETISAERWELDQLLMTPLSLEGYVRRRMILHLPVEKEFTITKLTIQYPDGKETFDAGSLKVIPTSQAMNLNTSFLTLRLPKDPTSPDYVLEVPEPFEIETIQISRNFVSIVGQFYDSGNRDLTIQKVEFNIPGLGIDPETIRFLQGAESGKIGELVSFASAPENAMYLENSFVENLPDQTFEETVTDYQFSIYAALRMDKEYDAKWCALYVSPTIHCIDNITGEEVIYGADMQYTMITPLLKYDEEVIYIINEKGV